MSALKALASKDEYRVVIISPLAIERAAATALLDERHDEPQDFSRHSIDENAYTWGRMYKHNVVITSLPTGMYGVVSATTTVLGLLASLPSVKIGLLVGVGAGIPESGVDIRLGDIAVGRPEFTLGGVVQYDTGKAKSGKKWERTGLLAPPPKILLNALAKLQAEHEIADSHVSSILDAAGKQNYKFAQAYKHPGLENDQLHEVNPDYEPEDGQSHTEREVKRPLRSSIEPNIYYGIIASGNKLVKDAETRQEIFAAIGQPCICLEMEAAGLMNSFPCLVIRGICDYADSHKNDMWQRYASATAAAFAKELLQHFSSSELNEAQKVHGVIERVQSDISQILARMEQVELNTANEKQSSFLRALYTCPYAERKDRNQNRFEGTCNWFTRHPLYSSWLHNTTPNLLWVSANPGCGKSVLARYLIDEALVAPDQLVCYFFFKEDFIDQRSSATAACAILRQLLIANPELLPERILKKFATDGNAYIKSFQDLWATFVEIGQKSSFNKIICVFDALDECQSTDRQQFLDSICDICSPGTSTNKISILATSRPYRDIKDVIFRWQRRFPIIHLSGDDDKERDQISEEIKIVINHRIDDFIAVRGLSSRDKEFLVNYFMAQSERTYLFVNLFLKSIETAPAFGRGHVRRIFDFIPATVDEAYSQILNRSPDCGKTKRILEIITAARRPLSLQDMAILLCLNGKQCEIKELEDDVIDEGDILETIQIHCSIVVIVVDSKVYLHHQTARAFLVSKDLNISDHVMCDMHDNMALDSGNTQSSWKHSIKQQESDRRLAERCLWFINLTGSSSYERSQDLFNYCASWWVSHFKKSNSIDSKLFDLATNACTTNCTNLKKWLGYHKYDNIIFCLRFDFSMLPISLLSAIGLHTVVEKLLIRDGGGDKDIRVLSTALWWAAHEGQVDTCRLLLRYGANPNTTRGHVSCLHEAARLSDSTTTNMLLENGVDVNAEFKGETALFNATRFVNADNVALLLKHGVNPKHKNLLGNSALSIMFKMEFMHETGEQNCKAIFKQLINHEHNFYELFYQVNRERPDYCHTCTNCLLLYAMEAEGAQSLRDRETTKTLRDNVEEERRRRGLSTFKSLLHFAVCFTFPGIVKQLLDVKPSSISGKQCISELLFNAMEACSWQHPLEDTIDILMNYGGSVDYKDAKGRTCLHLVMQMYDAKLDLVHRLAAMSSDINAQDSKGETPLIYGTKSNVSDHALTSRVKIFLEHGADCTLTNEAGKTAYSYAKYYGKEDTAELLREWSSSKSPRQQDSLHS